MIEIANDIKKEVSKRLPAANVSISEIKRTNLTYTGLIIRPENNNVAPTINIDGFISAISRDELTLEEVCEKIINIYADSIIDIPTEEITAEWILKNVYFQVVNKDRNKKLLLDVISRDIKGLNLCLIPYVKMKDTKKSSMGFKVTKKIMNYYNLSEEELCTIAEKNTRPVIKDMVSVVKEIMEEKGKGLDFEEMLFEEDNKMLICTNFDRYYGAATAFVGNTLKEIAERFDDDIIVLPSSVHEVIMLPASLMPVEDAKMMVYAVNRETVLETDFLSDNVYLYSRETGIITEA